MSEQLDWSEIGVVELPLNGERGQGKVALIDGDYDGEYLSGFKWYLGSGGYVYRRKTVALDGVGRGSIYLHREVCRPLKGHWVDHINRNTLDNRSVNLRSVSPSVNCLNRRQAVRTRRRKYRGVNQCSKNGFQVMFRQKSFGVYKSELDAARAYDELAFARYGIDAVLNFPRST